MKKYAVLIVLACLCAFQSAQAEEKKRYCRSSSIDYINPVLAGVERVVVAVDMVGPGSADNLPGPLKRANLEKLLQELYENRFSSHNGTLLSGPTLGCHDRNDQPVKIIDLLSKGGREAFEEETQKENTLAVLLKARIIPKGVYREIDMNSDFVLVYLDQMRSGVPDYKKVEMRFPFIFATSTDEKELLKLIEGYVKGNIR